MNIIALLESISLDKSRIGNFSKEDYTEIKKQLIAQKEVNSEIEDSDVAQLLKALKTHADSLQAVLNSRILFNFFAGKEYPRKYFSNEFASVEPEKLKSFVQLFLGDDLNQFFIQNLEADKYDIIGHLAEARNYFPDNLDYALKQHSLDKLDAAISVLKPPYGNFSKILYVRDKYFFMFLNHIKIEDWEIERKVKELYEVVDDIYKQNPTSELANKIFLAMDSYDASDESFSRKIRNSKEAAETKVDAHIPRRRNLTWVYFVVGAFVLIRIVVFFNTNSFNSFNDDNNSYDDEIEYKPEPKKLDPYYTNMKFNIDSFLVFLADYKESEIKLMSRDVSLKTGDNPFETFYQNAPTADSNHYITVTNSTPYDMVLLENTVMYDSIKMPRSAHFIKAGDNLEINFNSEYTNTIFNIYLGKKWATFQTNNNHLFIRNHSVIEYRFSELIPEAKKILNTDYSFLNDAVITYSHGGLDIDSQGATINPLSKLEE
jgi:hypothetical protein